MFLHPKASPLHPHVCIYRPVPGIGGSSLYTNNSFPVQSRLTSATGYAAVRGFPYYLYIPNAIHFVPDTVPVSGGVKLMAIMGKQ